MTISKHPSVVTMPAAEKPYPSIVEFLCRIFPNVPRDRWLERIRDGKVLDGEGRPIGTETAYSPSRRLFYFREIENEPVIPFAHQLLFQNDELLVACKPHFLPVTPGGRYVQECLLNRLREQTGIADLAPLHRLDRETAGIVIFSVNPKNRGRYHQLFSHGEVEKTYHAIAAITQAPQQHQWTVENRIVRGEPRFRMKIIAGVANSCSHIRLREVKGNRGLFSLHPVSGKTHQLRLHLSGLGFGIVNDRVYPELLPPSDDVFAQPLQLLAKTIRFLDPVAATVREFQSERELLW